MPGLAFNQHPVTRIGKIVGVLAVLAVLAMPASALVSFWAPPMMSGDCPLCPSMMHTSGSVTVQEVPAVPSCCDLSSSKPAPASVLQAPAATTLLAPPVKTSMVLAVAERRSANSPVQVFAAPPASSQAALCTFLI